jgi:hypothetical protein
MESAAEIPRSEVSYIVYSNGLKELYNPIVSGTVPAAALPEGKKPLYNVFAINCFDIFFTNFSCSYERFLKSGKYSFKVPVSVGLGGRPDQSDYSASSEFNAQYLQNRLYSGGLEFNIYPFGMTRHNFYIGISGSAGSFAYYKNSHYYIYNSMGAISGYVNQSEKHIGAQYAGMLHIGGNLSLSENFVLGSKLGLGYKREETVYEDFTRAKVQFDFTLGYRF